MILIALGLLFWSAAHFWKRLAPDHRESFGEKGKGIVTLGILVGLILMIIGYRGSDGAVYWGPSAAMVGINNLLMVFAVYLFAASGAKTRVTKYIKNPQLTAVKVWALAHLLVNGDAPSFLLFGGLLAWAVAEVVLLKRAGVVPDPYVPVPMKKEITAIIATVVVFVVIAAVHAWLGYNPFG